jgi:hypothetical protein
VDDDTASSRQELAGALISFFFADLEELYDLLELHGTTAEVAAIHDYLGEEFLLIATAKPFIESVDADDESLVEEYAQRIAAFDQRAAVDANKAGLFVCGAGRGYVIRIALAAGPAPASGTAVTLREGDQRLPHAGTVLDTTGHGSARTVVVALDTTDAPLHAPASASFSPHGPVEILDGSRRGRRIAYDGLIDAT